MPVEAELQENDVDLTRLQLEKVAPVPSAWDALSDDDKQLYHIHRYLQKTPRRVESLQLSTVDNLVFQADPFAWMSEQEPGVHLFADEPGVVVNSGKMWKLLELCYGTQASRLHAKMRVPSSYMIGTGTDVRRYLADIMDEVDMHKACQRSGIVDGVANFLAHSPQTERRLHLHTNRRGPVWTGEHVPSNAFVSDAESHVINEDGYQYAVLRGYRAHDDLWKTIQQRYGRPEARDPGSCTSFEIEAGDMPGHDVTHAPVSSEEECCAVCLADPGCGAFTYSPSRRHCWLKKPGAPRKHAAGDMRCGMKSIRGLPDAGIV